MRVHTECDAELFQRLATHEMAAAIEYEQVCRPIIPDCSFSFHNQIGSIDVSY
jgi:hypothetical protein